MAWIIAYMVNMKKLYEFSQASAFNRIKIDSAGEEEREEKNVVMWWLNGCGVNGKIERRIELANGMESDGKLKWMRDSISQNIQSNRYIVFNTFLKW